MRHTRAQLHLNTELNVVDTYVYTCIPSSRVCALLVVGMFSSHVIAYTQLLVVPSLDHQSLVNSST